MVAEEGKCPIPQKQPLSTNKHNFSSSFRPSSNTTKEGNCCSNAANAFFTLLLYVSGSSNSIASSSVNAVLSIKHNFLLSPNSSVIFVSITNPSCNKLKEYKTVECFFFLSIA